MSHVKCGLLTSTVTYNKNHFVNHSGVCVLEKIHNVAWKRFQNTVVMLWCEILEVSVLRQQLTRNSKQSCVKSRMIEIEWIAFWFCRIVKREVITTSAYWDYHGWFCNKRGEFGFKRWVMNKHCANRYLFIAIFVISIVKLHQFFLRITCYVGVKVIILKNQNPEPHNSRFDALVAASHYWS